MQSGVSFLKARYFIFIFDSNDFDLWLWLLIRNKWKIHIIPPSLVVDSFSLLSLLHDTTTKNCNTFHKNIFICDQCPMLFLFRYKNIKWQHHGFSFHSLQSILLSLQLCARSYLHRKICVKNVNQFICGNDLCWK